MVNTFLNRKTKTTKLLILLKAFYALNAFLVKTSMGFMYFLQENHKIMLKTKSKNY